MLRKASFKQIIIIFVALALFFNKASSLIAEDCFCGTKPSMKFETEQAIWGFKSSSEQSAYIINFMDQSVSKFNSLHVKSKKAQLPFKIVEEKKKKNQIIDIRTSFIKAVNTFTNNNQNSVLETSFMMGGIVNFDVSIEIEDNYETGQNVFNLVLNQNEYTRGKVIDKSKNKFRLEKSVTFKNVNNLELEICKFMYEGLLNLSAKEFKVNIENELVKVTKKKLNKSDPTTCAKDIVFKKRFSIEYLTEALWDQISQNQKNHFRQHRVTLEQKRTINYMKVMWNTESVSSKIKKKLVERIDDRSSTSEETDESEISEDLSDQNQLGFTEDKVLSQEKVLLKDEDDEIIGNKKINKQEFKNKVQEMIAKYKATKDPNVLNLRTRIVDKNLVNDSKKNTEINKTEINIKPDIIESDFDESSKSLDSEELSYSNTPKIFINSDRTQKKTKKVIVVLENIECSKCLNDIDSVKFLQLLKVQSRLI